ncbi:MAG: ATP-binding protein [bacterium]|nr:ATP-binding protein [bacterium]
MFDLNAVTSDLRMRAPRIICLGVEKIGKTTFAANAPGSILLPIKGEEGADDPDIQKVCKVLPVCNDLGDAFGWLDSLLKQEHPYQTGIIDSTSTLEALMFAAACQRCGLNKDGTGTTDNILKAGGGFGTGYKETLVLWRSLVQWLDALRNQRNMTTILIGHVTVGKFDDPGGSSYDQFKWDINEKAAALLYRWADVILFANNKVVVEEKDVGFNKKQGIGREINPGARFLYTQKRPSHPGGGRGVYGRLPYELPLTWQDFQNAVATASA